MVVCNHCSRTFASPRELTRHMAAVKAMATRSGKPRPTATAPPPRTGPAWQPPPPPPNNPWNAAPPPPPPPPAAQPASTWTPGQGALPTVEDAKAEVLVALENLYVLQCKATGITDEKRNAFDKYQKALTRALAPSPDPLMANEAQTALRVAAMHLVKLTF